ncbi:hypothetical protein JHK82_053495 [Glycine max]|uniref:Transmembrane protein n=2 Tax=Glycine subgen. Soja TaxID=1462606 RepID=K7MY59_SOYBN|nr:hypothetical protein JHK86_053346 [Glycine max]KAG4915861.1 hypothetical protein JHK87_053418 [Glycine soja]KAG4927802.1 hypothetical protein JHK85_054288 [Glycine max]KAG5083327.1 hypothetical protein JHK84_053365 [Glycine max]KAG5086098.1 hypothetical protein JHK82_053495 [Glycine max]
MAMALDAALWIVKMTWIALSGWISSCLIVADEFASSLRSGDIGPFHERKGKKIKKKNSFQRSCRGRKKNQKISCVCAFVFIVFQIITPSLVLVIHCLWN